MSWDIILFDLDGTLTDPKVGITTCAAYGLKQFGIEVEDLDTLTKFIGPPLIDSYMEYYGLTREQAEQAIVKYRERYTTVGWAENIPYTGIHQLCAKLKAAGKKLLWDGTHITNDAASDARLEATYRKGWELTV